uniref:Uncharacterized protein n=1 Tax=Lepeophtheirus salmonis TaxID=72036 RepID=A0A0K2UFC1_LEPSM
MEVFRTTFHWATSQTEDRKGDLREILRPTLYSTCFPILSLSQFRIKVVPFGILRDEEIFYILKYISKSRSIVSSNFPIISRKRACHRLEWNGFTHLNRQKYSIE